MNPNAAVFVPRFSAAPPTNPAPKPAPTPAPAAAPQPAESWDAEEESVVSKGKVESFHYTSDAPSTPEVPHQPTTSVFKIEEDDLEDDEEDEAAVAEEMKKLEVTKEEDKAPEDSREHVNLVFIGHVDAGKSTISGQIMLSTGQVDERTLAKYTREAKEQNRESWFLAYIMDTSEEERAKGKTVEVGRAHFETEKKRYTVLDAPGHKGYVPNMIGGASQADVAVLVISARKGEFETGFEKGGQTREHARLVKTIGVKYLIVVINKMDDPTVEWSQERYDECVTKLTPFLKATGFVPKKDLQFLPLSGYTGANLKESLSKSVCPWFDGPSLLGALDQLPPLERKVDAPLRMPVIDIFRNDRGVPTIMGKVEAGTVATGQSCFLMPGKIPIEILAIETETHKLKTARPGENVRIAIRGADESNVSSGFILCDKDLVPCVNELEAMLVIQELPKEKPLLTAGFEAIIHIHSIVEDCVITELVSQVDMKTNQESKKKPTFVKSGACVRARLTVSKPVCIETFNTLAQLGRFTLRDGTKTIGMGKVTAVGPKKPAGSK
jgi:peptide chain release factor subunit 3